MLEQEEIDKLVDGDEDEESYASGFADTVLNDNDDDTGSKLEPGSNKEHPKHMSNDDEIKKKDDEVEKEKEVVEIVMETNVDDTSAKKNEEVMTEKEVVDMSGKEFADTVTPTTATSSKTPSTTTRQKKSFTLKTRRLPGSIAGMCRRRGLIRSHIKTKFITREFFVEMIKEVIQHCDKIIPELTVTTTNEMLKKEMPRLVNLTVNKDREVSPVDISGMPEDVTPELIAEFQNIDKRVPTIFDHARMEATLRDCLSNLSRNAKEYAYHLEQSTKHVPYIIVDEPQMGLICLNSKDEKRVMYLEELVKFCDATLEKVLNEIANAEIGIFCEWKTNSTDDEASVIINP
ncbi:hypothetical protein Tco_0829158 [Tanacetum coccineum]